MAKKQSNGNPEAASDNGQQMPATMPAVLNRGGEAIRMHQHGEIEPIDPGQVAPGLRLIGTIVNRWAREFDTFIKVWYEVECGVDKHLMAQMCSKPLDPEQCLAIGECGAWEVWVHVYQDRKGNLHSQLTRKTSGAPSMPGTKPF